MIEQLKGLYAVLVTPFDVAGKIDEVSLDRLVDFYLERNVHGLVTLSVMGEGPLLLEQERIHVVSRLLSRVNGRVPVVVGINENGAMVASEFGQRLAHLGASALLLAPPSMSALHPNTVVDHYGTVAAATRLPIVVLDYPPLYGKMSIPLLKQLTDAVEEVCAIKMEDPPTPLKVAALRAAMGQRLSIFGGFGGVYCLPELERGSDGFMTGYAFPEHLLRIFEQFRAGDLSAAAQEYARWLPLMVNEGQAGIGTALRKEILRRRGAIACATVRAPTAALDHETNRALDGVLERAGVSRESDCSENHQSQGTWLCTV